MVNIKIANKIKETDPKAWTKLYESLIVQKIRQRYSINEELAILRQRDEKPEEFKEYHDYVEVCKAEAKAELEI